MTHESSVSMLRCRVDAEHLSTSVHYVPESEFLAWRREMEGRCGRLVSLDEASCWVPQSPAVERSIPDPNNLWPVVKVRFMPRDPRAAPSSNVQFLASDSLLAKAAHLAGLDVTPGYFLSALPFNEPVAEDFDEETAREEEMLAAIA